MRVGEEQDGESEQRKSRVEERGARWSREQGGEIVEEIGISSVLTLFTNQY